jgi:hypothetical protein
MAPSTLSVTVLPTFSSAAVMGLLLLLSWAYAAAGIDMGRERRGLQGCVAGGVLNAHPSNIPDNSRAITKAQSASLCMFAAAGRSGWEQGAIAIEKS